MRTADAKELVELLRESPTCTFEDRKQLLEVLINTHHDGGERARNVLATLRRERDEWDRIDEGWQFEFLKSSPVARFLHSIGNPDFQNYPTPPCST